MKKLAFVITFIEMLVCTPRLTHAQEDTQTAIEGYVFDSSQKPLANAIVTLSSMSPIDHNIVGSIATATNGSGFYQLSTFVDPVAINTVTADCFTSKGIAASQLPFYTPARPIVYKRDFYLTLPKKATSCKFP